MRAYVPAGGLDPRDKILYAAQLRTRGSLNKPEPPRDIQVQSGARKVLLTWKLPVKYDNITRWRVYVGTEFNLQTEIADRGTRQMFIDVSSGASPEVQNFFISSVTEAGQESVKVMVQGSALVEAGAPADPSTPPGYTSEGSGGGDTGLGRISQSTYLDMQAVQ